MFTKCFLSSRYRQVSVLSERVRNISEAVSTPPGTPDISRKAATPESPNLNKNASGSKTHIASQKSLHEVGNGIDKKAGNKDEEKKLIEAEKMETERVSIPGGHVLYVLYLLALSLCV